MENFSTVCLIFWRPAKNRYKGGTSTPHWRELIRCLKQYFPWHSRVKKTLSETHAKFKRPWDIWKQSINLFNSLTKCGLCWVHYRLQICQTKHEKATIPRKIQYQQKRELRQRFKIWFSWILFFHHLWYFLNIGMWLLVREIWPH